jgi:transcription elongation factor Elf1
MNKRKFLVLFDALVAYMGRRRRRVIRRVKRTLPKFFKCPRCGMDSVMTVRKREDESEHYFVVACGNCGLRSEYRGEVVSL